MKVSHVFMRSSARHVVPFVNFINDFIAVETDIIHQVIIFPAKSSDNYRSSFPNLKINVEVSRDRKRIFSVISNASASHIVVFHGLYDRRIVNKMVFFPRNLKHVMWSIWGADLYGQHRKLFKRLVNNICRRYVFSRIGTKIGQQGDYNFLRSRYGCKTEDFQEILFPAWFFLDKEITDCELIPMKQTETSAVIGNSGAEENNHLELIDIIARVSYFRSLTFILNYDRNEKYIQDIKQYAKQKLRDRNLVFLEKSLDYKRFIRLVRSHQTLIYNHHRQQGVSTLNIALHNGLSVFVRSDCPMSETYNQLGVSINDTLLLDQWHNEDQDQSRREMNRKIIYEKFHPEVCGRKYNELFRRKMLEWS